MRDSVTDPKAIFLGPYSENQEEFRKLVEFLLNDIIQWRRNYHPQKDRLITATDKGKAEWQASYDRLKGELDTLLGDMKQSIPFHNPRYLGHMISDVTLPSLLGYMAGQLYNANNVVGECSPVTTEKELWFISYLCEMLHYPPFEYDFSDEGCPTNKEVTDDDLLATGHLTGGGTVANVEALWTARNIKYFPVSLKLMLNDKAGDPKWQRVLNAANEIMVIGKRLKNHSAQSLFDLTPLDVLQLQADLKQTLQPLFLSDGIDEANFSTAINGKSVRHLGVYGIHDAVRNSLNEELPLPWLVVPQSRHYSWEKAMDILGLGSGRIKYVKVDSNFKIDIDDFGDKCRGDEPILMAVAVVGTTEEGVVDPVAAMYETRRSLQFEQGSRGAKGFWLHIDAAYGGYYASLFNDGKNQYCAADELGNYDDIADWLKDSLDDVKAIQHADSITIDPHKLGYVPYAAGAILYRDNRAKAFIEKNAPYLAAAGGIGDDPSKLYLGGSSLEGSRSGAAALACYLSARVLSNNRDGYGRLMAATFRNAKALINGMDEFNKDQNAGSAPNLMQVQVHPLYDSLTNIVCYAASVNELSISLTPQLLNRMNEMLYEAMSAEKNKLLNDYKFIVSKTNLPYAESDDNPSYATQISEFLRKFDIIPDQDALKEERYSLVLLRSVLMNPLMSDEDRGQIYRDFFNYLRVLINSLLPALLLEDVLKRQAFVRRKILWLENQERVDKLRRAIMSGGGKDGLDISRFLDMDFRSSLEKVRIEEYDVFIVDLNLADSYHKEWLSGIDAIRSIRSAARENSVVLVYSQFLNPECKVLSADGTPVGSGQIPYHQIIGNFLKHHFSLTDDHLVPKSIGSGTDSQPVEAKDLDLLTLKLAKSIFNQMGSA